jgi:hypothetical protein
LRRRDRPSRKACYRSCRTGLFCHAEVLLEMVPVWKGKCIRRIGAFSSEVETGSRQENASNQESRAPFRFDRNGKGSSHALSPEGENR